MKLRQTTVMNFEARWVPVSNDIQEHLEFGVWSGLDFTVYPGDNGHSISSYATERAKEGRLLAIQAVDRSKNERKRRQAIWFVHPSELDEYEQVTE